MVFKISALDADFVLSALTPVLETRHVPSMISLGNAETVGGISCGALVLEILM